CSSARKASPPAAPARSACRAIPASTTTAWSIWWTGSPAPGPCRPDRNGQGRPFSPPRQAQPCDLSILRHPCPGATSTLRTTPTRGTTMKSPALFISAALLFAPAAFAQEDQCEARLDQLDEAMDQRELTDAEEDQIDQLRDQA